MKWKKFPILNLLCLLLGFEFFIGCSPISELSSEKKIDEWLDSTRNLLSSSIRITSGESEGKSLEVQGDVLPVYAGAPYQTALAVNMMGDQARKYATTQEWEVIRNRLVSATSDLSLLTSEYNTGPMIYTAFEIAWANQMNQFLTPSQIDVFFRNVASSEIIQSSKTKDFDVTDAAIIGSFMHLLGKEDPRLTVEIQRVIDDNKEILCSNNVDNDFYVLEISALLEIKFPCAFSQVDKVWKRQVENLLEKSAAIQKSDSTMDVSVLVPVVETMQLYWPDDNDRISKVKTIVDRLSILVDKADDDLYVIGLQEAAFLLEMSISLSAGRVTLLVQNAVLGAEPRVETLYQQKSAYPFLDSRLLGFSVTLPDGFPEKLSVVERLSVSAATRDSLSPELKLLVSQVVVEKPEGYLPALAAFLLQVGTSSCKLPEIIEISAALAAVSLDEPLPYAPSELVPAFRLVQMCGQEVDSPVIALLRDSVADLDRAAKGEWKLSDRWEATSVACALKPENAEFGRSLWKSILPFVHEKGGIIGEDGYISLTDTHKALALLLSDPDVCKKYGMLGYG